jgi:uncharacterized protein GlcG (DUF336 family)
MTLSLKEARRYADGAIARANSLGIKISVAVLDELGQLVQMDRMDGARLMGPDIAEAKARTALNFQQPTRAVAERFAANPQFQQDLQEIVKFKLFARPGGLPIMRDGLILGAIGVSGGTPDEDEQVATAALG